MESFIKRLFKGEKDDSVHRQFVRFGKGKYEQRALLNLQKGSKIKLSGSFEYANDFVKLVSELGDVKFSGKVLSKTELDLPGKKKAGIYEYDFEGSSQDVKNLDVYNMLLDGEGEGISLKIKKKLPKPGKSGEGKVDDKFCKLEADLKYWPKIKEAFFWDIPDAKKIKASHCYIIEEIVLPPDEKDPEQMRLKAKRKGKIIRGCIVDKQERKEEKNFEA